MTDRVMRVKIKSKTYAAITCCLERNGVWIDDAGSYKITGAKRIYGTDLVRV